ncbi:MAG: hypothetical protein ACXAC5_05555 [Promethearchaeota archaeon]|jgi:hypothetical protein
MSIKRFFVRKILRKACDPKEVFGIPFKDMNAAEMKIFIETMYTEIVEMQGYIVKLKEYVSEAPAPCDKCCNEAELYCFKCEGTGIVRNKNLCNWPWD